MWNKKKMKKSIDWLTSKWSIPLPRPTHWPYYQDVREWRRHTRTHTHTQRSTFTERRQTSEGRKRPARHRRCSRLFWDRRKRQWDGNLCVCVCLSLCVSTSTNKGKIGAKFFSLTLRCCHSFSLSTHTRDVLLAPTESMTTTNNFSSLKRCNWEQKNRAESVENIGFN